MRAHLSAASSSMATAPTSQVGPALGALIIGMTSITVTLPSGGPRRGRCLEEHVQLRADTADANPPREVCRERVCAPGIPWAVAGGRRAEPGSDVGLPGDRRGRPTDCSARDARDDLLEEPVPTNE